MNTFTYLIGQNLYINLTNKCDNHCGFCIRNNNDGINDYKLWLDNEPTVDEVIELIKNEKANFNEVVFCGFGEPTYRVDAIIEIAKFVKEKGYKTRINTNGHADLINNKRVAPLFKGIIDVVNVSLNASNKEKYNKECNPSFENAYDAMIQFAKDCKDQGIDVVFSVVSSIGEEEIEKCREVASDHNIRYRVREKV